MIYITWEYNLSNLPVESATLGVMFYGNVASRSLLEMAKDEHTKLNKGDPAPVLEYGDTLVIMGDGYDIWVSYSPGGQVWN